MPVQRKVPWYELDKILAGLPTDIEHEILVQREAIPIIFVPGMMGSRLRVRGTKGTGKDAKGLPNLRWDPSPWFLYKHFSGCTPAHRKAMLIDKKFDPHFLEVDNSDPVGDGFQGLMTKYREFLVQLRERVDWGPLGKVSVFPSYGFGYTWTASAR